MYNESARARRREGTVNCTALGIAYLALWSWGFKRHITKIYDTGWVISLLMKQKDCTQHTD
jgi:hypothetical protein